MTCWRTTSSSGGLAIIVFTVLVKTLLLPLTIKSTRSSKAMQELQPKIAELKKKYGKDRQELSARTMELYRQYQVNPMAGCLPVLIQIPIFFGVYSAISSLSKASEGHFADSFLWLGSLGEADPYKILPFVAAGFQFVQTKMMRPSGQGKITDPQQAMMNTMMNFMPLMVIFFGWSFISGAVLYWAIQSVYSVVQQWLITGWGQMKDWFPNLPEMPEHRRLGYVAPRNLDDVIVVSGEAAEPPKGVMGWMQRRMAEAEKQQAARRAARGEAEPATATPRSIRRRPLERSLARTVERGRTAGNGARGGKNARRGPAAAGKSASARAAAARDTESDDAVEETEAPSQAGNSAAAPPTRTASTPPPRGRRTSRGGSGTARLPIGKVRCRPDLSRHPDRRGGISKEAATRGSPEFGEHDAFFSATGSSSI